MMLRTLLPPTAIGLVTKVFVIVGAARFETVTAAVATLPLVATGPVAVGAPVVLVPAIGLAAVTLIVAAQLLPAANGPAMLMRTLASPAVLAAPANVVTVAQPAGTKLYVVLASTRPTGLKVSGN